MFIFMYLLVRERHYHHEGSTYLTEHNFPFHPGLFHCVSFLSDYFSVWQTFKFNSDLALLSGANNIVPLQNTELSRWTFCHKLTQNYIEVSLRAFRRFVALTAGKLMNSNVNIITVEAPTNLQSHIT